MTAGKQWSYNSQKTQSVKFHYVCISKRAKVVNLSSEIMSCSTEEDNLDPLLRCHCPNIADISLRPCVDDMRSCGTVTRDLLRKQWGTNPTSTLRWPFLKMSLYSHDAFNRGLTPVACWTSVHFYGIVLRGKHCLPVAPWEPDRVPAPRRSLGPIGSRCCWSMEGDKRGVWRLHCRSDW